MARDYVQIVDVDEDGTISRDEFHEFFLTFDGISLSDDDINAMFDQADTDQGGHLST